MAGLALGCAGLVGGAGATITEFPLPTESSDPAAISVGYDGALWFTDRSANKIGRITTAGTTTEFGVPTPNNWPNSITASPDRDEHEPNHDPPQWATRQARTVSSPQAFSPP